MQERFQQGENVLLPAVLDLLNLVLPGLFGFAVTTNFHSGIFQQFSALCGEEKINLFKFSDQWQFSRFHNIPGMLMCVGNDPNILVDVAPSI